MPDRGLKSRSWAVWNTVLGLTLSASSASAADAAHGEQLFAACVACHSDTADAQGPSLKGVFGRKAAALDDFRYSSAMARADFIWDENNLREFLRDPQSKVKGNHMPFSGYPNIADADDVVAFLKTYK